MELHCLRKLPSPRATALPNPSSLPGASFLQALPAGLPAFHGGSHSLYTTHRRPRHRNLELTCFEPSDNAPYKWESDELPARSSTPSVGTHLP